MAVEPRWNDRVDLSRRAVAATQLYLACFRRDRLRWVVLVGGNPAVSHLQAVAGRNQRELGAARQVERMGHAAEYVRPAAQAGPLAPVRTHRADAAEQDECGLALGGVVAPSVAGRKAANLHALQVPARILRGDAVDHRITLTTNA